jgi:hypothetical protein
MRSAAHDRHHATARVVPGWRHSQRDSDALGPASVLEKLTTASVLLALVALASWFVRPWGRGLPLPYFERESPLAELGPGRLRGDSTRE